MRIDRYGFGELVVDGREIRTDVLLTPDGVQEHWWRREGHVLRLEDLGGLLDSNPERLIVGSGAFGRMRPDPGLGQELAARGVTVEVLPTAAAVDRINELLRLGRGSWAGALHLTCLARPLERGSGPERSCMLRLSGLPRHRLEVSWRVR